jgi:hypothetical protein
MTGPGAREEVWNVEIGEDKEQKLGREQEEDGGVDGFHFTGCSSYVRSVLFPLTSITSEITDIRYR